MSFRFFSPALFIITLLAHQATFGQVKAPPAGQALAVPTFHCLGLYWSPPGGALDRAVEVRYRVKDAATWSEGLSMRYNPIEGTEEDLTDYRGSIVHLQPGTIYEVALKLAGTETSTRLVASTWSERLPEGEVVRVPSGDAPLVITEGGKPDAWKVYDGAGATIDVKHRHNNCITVNASYVILRGFTLKGAGATTNLLKKSVGAIDVESGHDVVIEGCDISDWGRFNPKTGFGFNGDSAVLCRDPKVTRIVVQRCRLHHPSQDTNNWYEPKASTHPAGPQAISFFDTEGNHVIRYNECVSDPEHMFNDPIGGGANGSYRGAPGADSDIYGNFVTHAWDDGLEVEGGGRNVRVWDNYVSGAANMIANAATSIGPLYIWGNVTGRCQVTPTQAGYGFLKMGNAGGVKWQTGHQYIFHNTVFSEDGALPTGGLGGSRIVTHTITRNNILQVRAATNRSASSAEPNVDNDFDYDLFNGQVPETHEKHGVRGVPAYVTDAGMNAQTKTGRFQLAPGSPGAGTAQPLPNFTPAFTGKAPDMGAHQQGESPLIYGVASQAR
ncbi:hypothetical protein [Brevifollis gellanilyticus]|uniref:Right handed beta helix domain-containing protein n=1 Tax=Brevifollis gellanilyticus TaxID=748831 RepID=A0A512M2U4_9BACT|nr:hypothetical protein [Brevifollis gellanilyticus]GEP41064.1 hypothetical protein BGE01nite_03550 [Brevifollis gellanilyticus]